MAVGGSCHELAARTAIALLEQGATALEARIAAHIASFGGTCWQTDGTLAGILTKPGEGRYHRESIGRARRSLSRAGFLHVKRIFAGQTPDGADYPSSHGTTSKSVRWKHVGVSRPPKSVRRRESERHRAAERRERVGPRHSAAGAITTANPPPSTEHGRPPPTPDNELAQLLADFRSLQSSARAKRTASIEQDAVRSGTDPPDTS